MQRILVIISAIVLVAVISAATTITSAGSGNWSSTTNNAPWPGGVRPTASDDVVISSGQTVIIDDGNAVCNGITVNGTLQFANNGAVGGIVINGDLIVASTGKIRCVSLSPTGSYVSHSITVKGNITNTSGGIIDFRVGSNGTTGNGVNLTLSGSANTTITLTSATYANSTEEFNAIYIDKSGGAKVVLAAGNLFMSNNGSVDTSKLVFVNGIVETGNNVWVNLATAGRCVQGASATSYLNGILGRGLTNTASASSDRDFYIGDATTYRPVTVRFVAPAGANTTGHYGWAKLVSSNANTGSSTFSGGITDVSAIRYYEIGYEKGATGQNTMGYSFLQPTYRADDGIMSGSTDVRVAYSTDNRSTWSNAGPSSYTTNLDTPPTAIRTDTIAPNISLTSGGKFYIALATTGGSALPVEIVSLTATAQKQTALLAWNTATETNNLGFEVQRRAGDEWTKVGFVAGAGTSSAPRSYSYSDKAPMAGTYSYRLKQVDRDGAAHFSAEVSVTVGAAAKVFALSENYPNPFNPSTTIEFSVPENGAVTLEVYNTIGQRVASLFRGVANAGVVNTVRFDAAQLPSGIYFSRLQFKNKTLIGKMMLMK